MKNSVKSLGLRAATGLALVWGASAVYAQMPQKEQGPQRQAQQNAPDATGRSANREQGKGSLGADQAGTTAGAGGSNAAILSLSEEELAFVLRNVDLKSDGRLGIGGLSVGMTLGRDVQLRDFPTIVVEKLPQLRAYRYLVRENDVAFVDARESKVVLVREIRQ
jgi:hypothetical protein